MNALLRTFAIGNGRRKTPSHSTPSVVGSAVQKQLAQVAKALEEMGAHVETIPAPPDHPVSLSIESTAVLLPEVGIVGKPAQNSRVDDVEAVIPFLARHRPIQRISEDGTLDGSDVLRIGRTLFVAQTPTTNAEGIAGLRAIAEPFGYEVRAVELGACEHLKLATSFVPPHFLLANSALVNPREFSGWTLVDVDKTEQFAASTLSHNGLTLVSAACPDTEQRLRKAGVSTRCVDVAELHKMGMGVSSSALIVEPRVAQPIFASPGFKVVQMAQVAPAPEIFAPAIVHGGVVYVSGQLPIDPSTGSTVAGGIETQTEQVLRNLSEVLTACGSSLSSVLKLTFYLADTKAVDRVSAVCIRTFGGHRPSGIVVKSKTMLAGCAVAVDAIAAVGGHT